MKKIMLFLLTAMAFVACSTAMYNADCDGNDGCAGFSPYFPSLCPIQFVERQYRIFMMRDCLHYTTIFLTVKLYRSFAKRNASRFVR